VQAVSSVEDARATVRYWASQGFTSFKGWGPIKDEYLAAAIDEAHKLGHKFTADLGESIRRHRHAIDSGIDHLEHVIASTDGDGKPVSKEQVGQMIQYYIDHDVALTSTLSVLDNKIKPKEVLEFLTDYSRKEYERSPFGIFGEYISDGKALKRQQELQLEFWRKGGTLTVGTDPAVLGLIAGYGSLRAIELLVESGISPLEVIKIATLNGAEAIGIADDRGTIEIGKRADLIVVNGNPSTDIKDIYKIETVFKKGVGYDPAALKGSIKGTVGGPG
jgi:imidazolonepropionase-like amidohydrolase